MILCNLVFLHSFFLFPFFLKKKNCRLLLRVFLRHEAETWSTHMVDLISGKQVKISFLLKWVTVIRMDQELKSYHGQPIHTVRKMLWVFKHFQKGQENHYVEKVLFISDTSTLDTSFNSDSVWLWLLNSLERKAFYIYFPNTNMDKW